MPSSVVLSDKLLFCKEESARLVSKRDAEKRKRTEWLCEPFFRFGRDGGVLSGENVERNDVLQRISHR